MVQLASETFSRIVVQYLSRIEKMVAETSERERNEKIIRELL
jgi:hypothetical protein